MGLNDSPGHRASHTKAKSYLGPELEQFIAELGRVLEGSQREGTYDPLQSLQGLIQQDGTEKDSYAHV